MGRKRVRMDSTLCEEDELAPSNNCLRPDNLWLVFFSHDFKSVIVVVVVVVVVDHISQFSMYSIYVCIDPSNSLSIFLSKKTM